MKIKNPRKLLLLFGLGALVAAFVSFIGHFALRDSGSAPVSAVYSKSGLATAVASSTDAELKTDASTKSEKSLSGLGGSKNGENAEPSSAETDDASYLNKGAAVAGESSQDVPNSTAIKVNGGYEEALPKDSPAAVKYTKIARATGYLERYPQLANSEFTTRDGQKLVKDAAVAFDKMKAAARGDGVSLRILSGFRDINTQVGIFEGKIKKLGSGQRAAEFSAPPGHSQHHTGLALDLNSLQPAFRATKEYRWLKSNAPKFGFMLSYENDESRCDLGPHNEPWHWVYIGEPAAKSLMQDFIDRAMKCGYNPEKP